MIQSAKEEVLEHAGRNVAAKLSGLLSLFDDVLKVVEVLHELRFGVFTHEFGTLAQLHGDKLGEHWPLSREA